jgi:hypothetical protein
MDPDVYCNATGLFTISFTRTGTFIAKYANSLVCVPSFEPGFRDTIMCMSTFLKSSAKLSIYAAANPGFACSSLRLDIPTALKDDFKTTIFKTLLSPSPLLAGTIMLRWPDFDVIKKL